MPRINDTISYEEMYQFFKKEFCSTSKMTLVEIITIGHFHGTMLYGAFGSDDYYIFYLHDLPAVGEPILIRSWDTHRSLRDSGVTKEELFDIFRKNKLWCEMESL